MTARNDDHGGGLLRRMQIFIDGLLEQARRHGVNSELIIVEWNPPEDRPRLADALRWPEESGPCTVRIIEVPPEIHSRFPYADRLGLFQMMAKNVGIRRARGQFILATNVDILFSDSLMQFMTSGPLDAACMYRIDRTDVSPDVPIGVPVAEQLEFCQQHVLRVCTRWGTFESGQIRLFAVLKRGAIKVVAQRSVLIQLALERARHVMGRVRRRFMMGFRPEAVMLFLRSLLHRGLHEVSQAATGLYQAIAGSLKGFWRRATHPLHTNACGDFTFLARERWFALRGYPELRMFSLHLDSVLCQMAVIGGAREVVLGDEMRLYHMEHRSGWSPGEAETLTARMSAQGVPILDYHQYRIWVNEFRRRGVPIIFNGEDWGLAQERLHEADPVGRVRPGLVPVGEHIQT